MGTTVIGIAGKIRAGKETVGAIIRERTGAVELTASTALYETLELFGVPTQRKNTQALSTFLRESFGTAVLQAPLLRTIEQSRAGVTVVGSLRRESDFSEIARRFRFVLVYVDAPLAVRYARFSADLKSSEDGAVVLSEFEKLDRAETEQEIESLKSRADFLITNTASIQELEEKVAKIVIELRLGLDDRKAVAAA